MSHINGIYLTIFLQLLFWIYYIFTYLNIIYFSCFYNAFVCFQTLISIGMLRCNILNLICFLSSILLLCILFSLFGKVFFFSNLIWMPIVLHLISTSCHHSPVWGHASLLRFSIEGFISAICIATREKES